ncbi:MAG: hypothetical protein RR754_02275, partial [Oscillospiraceae bacterium]
MQDALVYVGNIFASKQSLQASISELPLNITELYISIGLVIIMFLLTFLAYSLLAGILASMTTSIEDYQQLQTPLMLILMFAYYM